MCDNPECGDIFSEMEEGWSTAQQAQVIMDENGQRKTVVVNIDLCPEHSGNTKEVARRMAAQRKQRRVERLELEAGVRDDLETRLRAAEAVEG